MNCPESAKKRKKSVIQCVFVTIGAPSGIYKSTIQVTGTITNNTSLLISYLVVYLGRALAVVPVNERKMSVRKQLSILGCGRCKFTFSEPVLELSGDSLEVTHTASASGSSSLSLLAPLV